MVDFQGKYGSFIEKKKKKQIKVHCPTAEATTVVLHIIFLSVPKKLLVDMPHVIKELGI